MTLGLRGWFLSFSLVALLLAPGCNQSALPPDGGNHSDDAAGPDMASACGDRICGPGESCSSCSVDCGLCAGCGDGKCQASESCSSCPQDCYVCPTCGDGFCTAGETCENCAPDCGLCVGCGNARCEGPNEDCFTCPGDCGACMGCGDGRCLAPETCASCQRDCGVCSVCGNVKCEGPYESCVNCPQDCGACQPVGCFEMLTCAIPCIDLMSMPPLPRLTCVADCVARGCADAQFFFDQAFQCFITNLPQCGPNLGCVMQKCQAEVNACIASRC